MSFSKRILGLALLAINLLALGVAYMLPYRTSKVIDLPVLAQSLPTHAVLYFGYTACPSVCPNTLFALKKVQDSLQREDMAIVFISITQPDTLGATAAEYARSFHSKFIGWQLPPDTLKQLMKDCAAVFSGKHHTPNLYLCQRQQQGQWLLKAVYHQYPPIAQDIAKLVSEEF